MKLNLKSIFVATSLGLGMSLTATATGIPVVDGASISTNIQNQIQTWMLEANRWSEKITQFEKDFSNQQEQLQAVTGVTDIQGFMNEASSILDNITNLDSWLGRQDEILSKGYDILSPELKKIFDSYELDNLCSDLVDKKRKNCEGNIIIDAVKQVQVKRDIKQVKSRVNTINSIAKKMQTAQTQKEAQDLSNAMQTQIALLEADKISMDIARASEELAKAKADKQRDDYVKMKARQHVLTRKTTTE